MKKIIALLLCIIFAVSIVSCGTAADQTEKAPITPDSVKTLGDYFAIDKDGSNWGYGVDTYIAVFKYDGKTYRVAAKFTPDMYVKAEGVDFFDEKREEKLEEIFKDAEVFLFEDMEKYVPTDADLKALEGKTGQQLLDDDFYETGYSLWGEEYFYLSHGMIEYKITFNEKVTIADDEDFNVEDVIKNMTVKKAEFSDFNGRATDAEMLPQN